MKFAFLKREHDSEFRDQLLDLVETQAPKELCSFPSNRQYSHSETVFSDGMHGTSLPFRGVCFRMPAHPEHYDVIVLTKISQEQESRVRDWFREHEKAPYDWRAYFGRGDTPGAYDCTEANICGAQNAGLLMEVKEPWREHSDELAALALAELGGVYEATGAVA